MKHCAGSNPPVNPATINSQLNLKARSKPRAANDSLFGGTRILRMIHGPDAPATQVTSKHETHNRPIVNIHHRSAHRLSGRVAGSYQSRSLDSAHSARISRGLCPKF